jgi:flavin-dependent dehydrogenase
VVETIETNICIVGAGPAGSVTSIVLSKMGIPHLIVDAAVFPRDKICGDGLDLKVVRVLNNIDPSIIKDEFSNEELFMPSMGMRFIYRKENMLTSCAQAMGMRFSNNLFFIHRGEQASMSFW